MREAFRRTKSLVSEIDIERMFLSSVLKTGLSIPTI
jgi:hypothetical protein